MIKAKDTLITQIMRDDVSATPRADRGLDKESVGGELPTEYTLWLDLSEIRALN